MRGFLVEAAFDDPLHLSSKLPLLMSMPCARFPGAADCCCPSARPVIRRVSAPCVRRVGSFIKLSLDVGSQWLHREQVVEIDGALSVHQVQVRVLATGQMLPAATH